MAKEIFHKLKPFLLKESYGRSSPVATFGKNHTLEVVLLFRNRKRITSLEARVSELERVPADPRSAELRELEQALLGLVRRRDKLQAEHNDLDADRQQYRYKRDVNITNSYSQHFDALYMSTFDREEELRIMLGQLTQQIDQLRAELADRRSTLAAV